MSVPVLKLTDAEHPTEIYLRCDLIVSWKDWEMCTRKYQGIGGWVRTIGGDVFVCEPATEITRLYAEATV